MNKVLTPHWVDCNESSEMLKELNYTAIQRIHMRYSNFTLKNGTDMLPLQFNYSHEFGKTVFTEFKIVCDLDKLKKLPRFSHYFGFFVGSFILGLASDRGGRKMIILACMWTTGVMSLFQLVGNDFISYVFFQFFIGLFVGVSLEQLNFDETFNNCIYSDCYKIEIFVIVNKAAKELINKTVLNLTSRVSIRHFSRPSSKCSR